MKVLRAKDWLKDPKFPFTIDKHHVTEGYEPHRHEFFEFFYIPEGKFLHSLDDSERIVSAGDLILMNPSHKHSFKLIPGEIAVMFQCIFEPSFLGVDTKTLRKTKGFVELLYMEPFYEEGFRTFHVSGMNELKVRALMFEMLYEFSNRPKGFEVAIKAKLMDLLVTLVRLYEAGKKKGINDPALSKKAQAITDSISYIDAHFKEPLKLEDISLNKAGLTKEYYCTVFKKITGKTFTEYVTHLRIEEAKRLLVKGALPVTEICYEAGFNDLSHFTRTFKSITGKSPSKYKY